MIRSQSKQQARISTRIRNAKKDFWVGRPEVCAGCKSNAYISTSHTISVKRCKELGKEHLAWDKKNFQPLCMHSPTRESGEGCHQIWESGPQSERMNLNNYKELMAYVEQHDPERYKVMQLAES